MTAGKSTKFGIPVHDIEQVLAVASKYDLKITGIHQHIGSGISTMKVLGDAINILLAHARRFPDLEFVNIGGGFNIPYRPEDHPIDFENFESTIVSQLLETNLSDNSNLEYWFEPGRFLVAESGVLLVRSNTIKAANGRVFAGTDSGMSQLVRPAFYQAYHEIYNLSNPTAPRNTYEIVGNICESGDIFAKGRPVQHIREGDILAIMDAGAYGMSMASVYNLRPLPAEVLVCSDGTYKCIQPRLSPEDLIHALYASYFDD